MKLNKFQGKESEELTLRPVVAALKRAKMVSAKIAKKTDSKNCFLLALDKDDNKYSWPCGPSVSKGTPLSELMFIEKDGVDIVCLPGSTEEFEAL